ncbi:hypothetical protein AB0L63_04015 [Nocardia sp. NPDC051990]|uniref:hypothetical protein n=1 Tax=Nocardia sp. NPDC051990 TaxID=3155285 RepID=UPI003448EA73
MLQDGVLMFVVFRDAGRGSVTVTDRVYGHNDRRASESAAQVIARRLPRVRANMLARGRLTAHTSTHPRTEIHSIAFHSP